MVKGLSVHKKILIKSVIIVALIIAAVIYSKQQVRQLGILERQERQVRVKANEYESRFNNFDSRKAEIKEALNTWLTLTGEQKGFEGLKISAMKSVLDEMSEKHLLVKLDIKMSKPEILQGVYRASSVAVQASDINLRVRGYSDVQILSFIYDLFKHAPGYLDVTSFQIKQELPLNDSTFLKLASDVKLAPVSANLIVKWHELQNK